MASNDISPAVRRLLDDHVETYEQLEVLMLFGRDGSRSCDAASAADQLKVPISSTADALEHLANACILSRAPSGSDTVFVVRPDHVDVVESLKEEYRSNRLAIVTLMSENAMERLRTSALRTFSAAFLLRRKHDG